VTASSSRRDVVILGSTGSIGTQALDVVRANPDRFRLVGLTAGGSQAELFEAQVTEFAPAFSGLGEDASGMFGVTTVALRMIMSRSSPTACSSSRRAPDSDTITGSTTTGASGIRSSALATASIVGWSPSMPIFTASTPMSSATALTCATITSGGTAWTAVTPTVF
jgi:1-deoxy-D-xylulose 5-phosphate reductoisomerase